MVLRLLVMSVPLCLRLIIPRANLALTVKPPSTLVALSHSGSQTPSHHHLSFTFQLLTLNINQQPPVAVPQSGRVLPQVSHSPSHRTCNLNSDSHSRSLFGNIFILITKFIVRMFPDHFWCLTFFDDEDMDRLRGEISGIKERIRNLEVLLDHWPSPNLLW